MNRSEILAAPPGERFYLVWRVLRVNGYTVWAAGFHASALCPDVPIESQQVDRISSTGEPFVDTVGVPTEKVPACERRVLRGV